MTTSLNNAKTCPSPAHCREKLLGPRERTRLLESGRHMYASNLNDLVGGCSQIIHADELMSALNVLIRGHSSCLAIPSELVEG